MHVVSAVRGREDERSWEQDCLNFSQCWLAKKISKLPASCILVFYAIMISSKILFTSCTSSLSANYQRFLTHSLLKPLISIMSTLALQLGQHFMFQKFEQTMVNLIFDTMDLHYGMKLMRDLRF